MGLDAEADYHVTEVMNETYHTFEEHPVSGGDELMQAGLILSDYANGVRTSPVKQGDGQARLFLLEIQKDLEIDLRKIDLKETEP